jgi:hypothetical protein
VTEPSEGATEPDRWLLLIHRLPAKPAYARVKIWRRLQALGAVAVKQAVYALPVSAQAQEDFSWLLKEIAGHGGEALLCEARLLDGLSDQAVRVLFRSARDADYTALAREARMLASTWPEDAAAQIARLRARARQIAAIDFFGAAERLTVERLLGGLAARAAAATAPPQPEAPGDLRGRVWVTRKGVHIDRIACAWLVRRFIDSSARFKFVSPDGYTPAAGELRFDMFEAEFTHVGDRCSFEMLLAALGASDNALAAIGEIVHDIDLKDGKFARPEAAGIARLIQGIAARTDDDAERLARGGALLDDLYEAFRARRR